MTTTNRKYPRGSSFPNEGFVQKAIETFFKAQGYLINTSGAADLVCNHPETGQQWIVEAKGRTSSVGLDFRTGLGQILQRMSDDKSQYGIAVPAIPQFVKQCRLVNTWVRQSARLSWLLVDANGSVTVYEPSIKP